MDSEQLLHTSIEILEQFQAQNMVVLKVDNVCDFADYFVIVSGTSTKHVQSMAEELILKLKHAQMPALSIEGLTAGDWVLLDFGRVVTHLFLPEKRAFYNLEELWKQGTPVAVPETT